MTKPIDPKYQHLKLKVLPGEFKYVLFQEDKTFQAAFPKLCALALETHPFFLFRSSIDRSAIVPSEVDLPAEKVEGGWLAIRISGDMPFGTVQGLIATITDVLKQKGLGACVISTYLTDFFLVRQKNFAVAKEALEGQGWEFE